MDEHEAIEHLGATCPTGGCGSRWAYVLGIIMAHGRRGAVAACVRGHIHGSREIVGLRDGDLNHHQKQKQSA